MHAPQLRLETFDDYAAMVTDLHESFRQAHAAAIVDEHGVLIDLTAFTRKTHTADTALDWAHCLVLNEPTAARIVILSVVCRDVRRVREEDIETLARAREVFGALDVDVLDWIQFDGDRLRSLALTIGLDTWTRAGDPVVRKPTQPRLR